mgnify:CR=1 FL=1
MKIGDIVARKSYDKDVTFKVIDIEEEDGEKKYILKGINIRIIADSKEEDLQVVEDDFLGKEDKILNRKGAKLLFYNFRLILFSAKAPITFLWKASISSATSVRVKDTNS